MESKKFVEIKKPVAEVREIENTEQEQKKDEKQGSKVIEKLEETILPTAYASDDEKQKEGAAVIRPAALYKQVTPTGFGLRLGARCRSPPLRQIKTLDTHFALVCGLTRLQRALAEDAVQDAFLGPPGTKRARLLVRAPRHPSEREGRRRR